VLLPVPEADAEMVTTARGVGIRVGGGVLGAKEGCEVDAPEIWLVMAKTPSDKDGAVVGQGEGRVGEGV
jgi:hypothetical protein